MTPEEKAQKKLKCRRKLGHRADRRGYGENVRAIEQAIGDLDAQ